MIASKLLPGLDLLADTAPIASDLLARDTVKFLVFIHSRIDYIAEETPAYVFPCQLPCTGRGETVVLWGCETK